MTTDGDRLRTLLQARDGETVYEAAERVVRERDAHLQAYTECMDGWLKTRRPSTGPRTYAEWLKRGHG